MKEIKLKAQSGGFIEFTEGDNSASETKAIILAFGEDFSGKSRFGATGPSVIGGLPLDRKTRFSMQKTAAELGKRLMLPKVDLVREGNMSVRGGWEAKDIEHNDNEVNRINEQTKKAYRGHVNMIKETAWALHDNKDVKIIQIDLFEQFYQDMIYAHYGRTGHMLRKLPTGKYFKETKEADQELVDFVNSLTDKHLVLTHRRKDEYDGDNKTGRMTWSGYKHLGHSVNMVIEHVLNKKYDPRSDNPEKSFHYAVNVRKCLHNAELEGPDGQGLLKDDFITFSMLMMQVFPSSELSDWE